jgi:hypothetical protein
MKRKSGLALTLIAEGFLVDAETNLPYNTYINNAIGERHDCINIH